MSLPGTRYYRWFPKPARDPLTCWPDEYEPSTDTPAWAAALTNWPGVKGFRRGILADTGFMPATVNYAFNNLVEHIPSSGAGAYVDFGYENGDAFLTKQRNFYGALQYIQHHPNLTRMNVELGCGKLGSLLPAD